MGGGGDFGKGHKTKPDACGSMGGLIDTESDVFAAVQGWMQHSFQRNEECQSTGHQWCASLRF